MMVNDEQACGRAAVGSVWKEHRWTVVAGVMGVGCAAGAAAMVYQRLQKHSSTCCHCCTSRKELQQLRNDLNALRAEIEQMRADAVDELGAVVVNKQQRQLMSSDSLRSLTSDDEFVDASDWPDEVTQENGIAFSPLNMKQVFERVNTFLDQSSVDSCKAAYDLMRKAASYCSNDAEFLWRYARTCHLYASSLRSHDKTMRKQIIYEGRDNAIAALDITKDNADVYKWCAVLSGTATDFMPIKEKIKEGFNFKTYVDGAIALRPDDNITRHMRGRWSYAVSQLSWIERKFASTLFVSPPNATVDDALIDFLEAERLKPNEWIENLVYVAKCYIALRDVESAIPYLRTAMAEGMIVTDSGDEVALAEAETLLKTYS